MAEPTDPDLRMRLRAGAVVWREIDGEVVGLTLARGEYVSVNRSGILLWQMLGEGASVRTLAAALAQRWGLDGDRATADAERFVAELAAQDLLEPAGSEPSTEHA